MDKYAIYLRKSRADLEAEKLGEGETLARHKKILTELASRKGLYVEKIYHEIVSGETIANRPEIQRLIADAYEGKYRGIIVVDVDRLSRGNQADMQTIMDCLKYANNRNGLLVVTPTKTYDVSHNYDDEEYIEFVLFMSRREYKTILKRLERGRRQAVVEGNFLGSYRPYGYDILKNRAGRTLIPNAEEAPIAKKIFEWTVDDHMTPGKIAKKLTAMGVPTYRGDTDWNLSTIKTILSNPVYCGKVRWNDRMRIKKMVDGKMVSSRPRSNHTEHYMLHDGKHQALVSEEMFMKTSSRFHADKTKGDLKLKNPLAGLLFCKKCEKAMVYQSYPSRPNTEPRFCHRFGKSCNVKSATYRDVMDALTSALDTYIDDFELKIDNLPDVDENSIQDQITALENEIRKTEKKLSKLFDSWEDGIIDNNEFVQRKEVHNLKIDAIKRQIEDLEKAVPEKEEYQEKIMSMSDALSALKDDALDADIKNEYLKKNIEKIEFSRDNDDEFILDIYF